MATKAQKDPLGVAIFCVSTIIFTTFPLILITFIAFRLKLRKEMLKAKIQELGLQEEYLRVYEFDGWKHTKKEKMNDLFIEALSKRFQGDNSPKNYFVPILLSLISCAALATVTWCSLFTAHTNADSFIKISALLLATVGAFLYAYPILVNSYARLSLTPQAVLDLLGKLWLAFILGIVLSYILKGDGSWNLVGAFMGSILPIFTFEWIVNKYNLKKTSPNEEENKALFMQVLDNDITLYEQLNYIGIRTVNELAMENPLRVFAETDLNLMVALDIIDRANFFLWIPELETRMSLGKLGIRTAVDLMVQAYDYFPIDFDRFLNRFPIGQNPQPATKNDLELRTIVDKCIEELRISHQIWPIDINITIIGGTILLEGEVSRVSDAAKIYTTIRSSAGVGNVLLDLKEWRFLEPSEALPEHFREPMNDIRKAFGYETVDSVRSLIESMRGNTQLSYIFGFWTLISQSVEASPALEGVLDE